MTKRLTEDELIYRAALRMKGDIRTRLMLSMEQEYRKTKDAESAYPLEKMSDFVNAVSRISERDGEENKKVREETRMFMKWTRIVCQQRIKPSEEWYRMIFDSYCIAGRWYFDEYMSAVEFYRTKDARFWWPRRKVLEGRHKIATQIQDFLDDDKALYLGLSMPPGAGKSTLIKFLLAYIAGRWSESANMYVSYSVGMVKMMLDSVNSILTDDTEYRAEKVFPHMNKPEVSNEYFTVSFRRKGDFPTIGFVSLGGSVTGRTRANRFMVTDDLVKNSEEARSPERLGGLWNDYISTITTRQIGDNVKQIQLGTIWSVHDPISRMKSLHEGDKRYRFIAIPVEDEEGHSNFDYDHPDRYSDEKIKTIRNSMDPVDYSCLYLQRGIEKEGMAFPKDSLTWYNGELPEGEPDRVCFACDPAFGGGDSLAMPIAYVYGEEVYIPDVVYDRRAKDKTEPEVARRIVNHGCGDGRFEANNGGDFYADDVGELLKEAGHRCNITTKRAGGMMSKEARIEQYSVDIKRMRFLNPQLQSSEYRGFMNEVMRFSFTAKNEHDDAPDSLAMLAAYLNEKKKKISVPGFYRPV